MFKTFTKIAIIAVAALISACSSGTSESNFDLTISDVHDALANNNIELAQRLADSLRDYAFGKDSLGVTDIQAANLSIVYMHLSERTREDENIADATQLFRYAFRHSPDSLRRFYQELPLDDTRHFVLLTRLGLSIDNPIDLEKELASDTIPEFTGGEH